MKHLLTLFLFASTASAVPIKIDFSKHRCPDSEQIVSECAMRYTGVTSFNLIKQRIHKAAKQARFVGKEFVSIDAIVQGKPWDNNRDYLYNMYIKESGSFIYGAWWCADRILVALMPTCTNIDIMLVSLLRDIKRGRAKRSCPPKQKSNPALEQYLRGEAPVFENPEIPDYLK